MNILEVKDIDGTYNMYNSNGDMVGRVCTDGGKAMIGNKFYSVDETCENVSDDPESLFVCSRCGCEMWLVNEEYHLDDVWENPMYYVDGEPAHPKFCPNCRSIIIGKTE